jgi:hypothetical protein
MKRSSFAAILAWFVALPLLLLGQNAEPVMALKVRNPIAISGTPGTGYFVLTDDGAVYRYVDKPSGLTFAGKFGLPTPGEAYDLTTTRAENRDSVIVTSWLNAQAIGWIHMISPEGKVLHSWVTRKLVSGLATDERNHIIYFSAYFSSAESNELYRIKLPGGQPEFVCTIRGVKRAGAIAVDSRTNTVYVSDPVGGGLIQIDILSKRSTPLSTALRLPSALYLQEETRTIYIADALQKAVYAMNLAGAARNLTIVSRSSKFRSPTGLAPGPRGTLLVADSQASAVFLLRTGPQPADILGNIKKR